MASPTYPELVEGIHRQLLTLARFPHDTRVQIGEPTSVQSAPMVYAIVADEGAEFRDGKVFGMYANLYRTMHRLVLDWQDPQKAELDAMYFVQAIPDALRRDPRLTVPDSDPVTYLVPGGQCRITECKAGWAVIAKKKYRVVDFYSEVADYPYALPEA